jgi:hypothetical protein
MRWTLCCRLTSGMLRTVKSCGLDASTLALTLDNASHCGGMVARKPDHQREHEANRKTLAQGMPDRFGEPVVTTCVLSTIAHKAAGESIARHSLRPLHSRDTDFQNPGARALREGGAVFGSRHCEERSDDAIQHSYDS